MDRGVIQVYYGEGHGKSTAAIGNAIRIAAREKASYHSVLEGKK